LQTVDICFCEDSALAGYLVQLHAKITLIRKLDSRYLQLGIDLVDDRSCAACALVVHRRYLLFASSLFVIFEDDDLGVLTTQFDNRVHLRMRLLDRK
jgi:hypothetical protein